jgi:hypothetical protein
LATRQDLFLPQRAWEAGQISSDKGISRHELAADAVRNRFAVTGDL